MSSFHYNVGWLDDQTQIANFVARQDLFDFLRDELVRTPRSGSVQHYLLVGLRGSGKSTLLQRLGVAIRQEPALNDHLLSLSFPEELYEVKNLADFWWACCEALVAYLDRQEQSDAADELQEAIEQRKRTAEPLDPSGLQLLQKTCHALNRRPVLLVDNLDMLLNQIASSGKKRKDEQATAYWALREALSTTDAPMVIGGSVRLSEPFTDYDKAFYDFFIPKRLGKISLEETQKVLDYLIKTKGSEEVAKRLQHSKSRIEALYELTGGNLRAIGFIFELLLKKPGGRTVEDFESLMDTTTPYYKARFEDMPLQARAVMHALAVRRPDDFGLRFGHTAAGIAEHCGLATNIVSAQLDTLEQEGLVEKSAEFGRMQYRIAEQLFRLWLQLRGNRRIRQNVIGLAEFLQAMFDQIELTANLSKEEPSAPLSQAKFAFALSDGESSSLRRYNLETHGAEQLKQHICNSGERLDDYVQPNDLPENINKLIELGITLKKYHGDLSQAEQQAFLGSTRLRLTQKETLLQALATPAQRQQTITTIREHLRIERQNLLRFGLLADDLPFIYHHRASGRLSLPYLTVAEIEAESEFNDPAAKAIIWRLVGSREIVKFSDEASAEAWLTWGLQNAQSATANEWANIAGCMRRSKCLDTAQLALQQAIAHGETARTCFEQAALLVATNKDANQAEVAYRQAILLDPEFASPWFNLGNLLADKLDRLEEAEAAYRKAILLDPEFASHWFNLGYLLADQLNRHEEAEAAYRQAITLDLNFALPWNGLGNLLQYNLNQPEEAEAAYRQAIAIDPNYALPWNNLGVLLADKLNRPEEAEAAYRRAIAIDPNYALPWNNLGELLADILNRPEEALAAFDRAAEIEKILHPYWVEQRNLLRAQLCIKQVRQDLVFGNLPGVQASLKGLQQWPKDLADILVTTDFVEEGLRPMLDNPQTARTLLNQLWEAGFEKSARPLLLAFAAAIEDKSSMLDVLEPEVQKAAKLMYKRLTANDTSK